MKGIIRLCAVLLCCSGFAGERKITGAFGFTFGRRLQGGEYMGKDTYHVTPRKPLRDFTLYLVLTTPKSKKIYGIGATRKFATKEERTAEVKLLLSLLETKYGPSQVLDKETQIRLRLQHMEAYVRAPVVVKLATPFELRNPSLTIYYEHTELAKLAEKERIEIEAANTDASGL